MLAESQIETIRVTRLEPGDVLVLKCQHVLSRSVRQRLRDQILELMPDGVKAMVLDGGMDLEVMRKDEVDASAT